MKNTDLPVKILLLKCYSPLLKILVLENQCKVVVPLFGAAYAAPNKAYAAPNKGTTILYGLRPPKNSVESFANGTIQGLFNAFEHFSSTFQGKFYFQGLLKTFLYIEVLFKPVRTLLGFRILFCHLLLFFKINCFKNLSGKPPERQIV